uniref:NADP-dependent oxidoreductase domain-containing protein n=1 Tax=Panagrolaimus davidi TaxID=227884 RepID=A0A914QSA6_9BILA
MATPKIPSIKMHNGVELPLVGYGTWQATDEKQVYEALKTALESGYRLIDTAHFYQNEKLIGKILKEFFDSGKLKRSDIFLTTKLPPFYHRSEDVEKCFEEQLKDLQMDYVDLYLIHTSCACIKDPNELKYFLDENGLAIEDNVDILETWRALEKLYKSGKAKSIGVSNFNEKQIERICQNCEIVPHNNQVECHILLPQNELFNYCKSKSITMTSYASLGSPGRTAYFCDTTEVDFLNHPKILEIAKKHGKKSSQILLKQLVQRGIAVIPKSINPARIAENINIFDFELDESDTKSLENMRPKLRLFPIRFLIKHSEFPFQDILDEEEKQKSNEK